MYENEQTLLGVDAWTHRTLVDLLTFRRLTRADHPIFFFLGDGENVTATLSANELHRQAELVSAHLHQTLSPGTSVILLFENSPDYIVAFFSCLYAGMVPISGVYPTSIGALERFSFIAKDSGAGAVIGKRETLRIFHDSLREQKTQVKWIPVESASRHGRTHTPENFTSDKIALIQYTSGSTEDPKGVCLTHRNLCYNIHAQLSSFKYRADDRALSWLPFTHDMGLVGAVLPGLALGGPFYFMPPDKFIEKPARWLSAISRFKITGSGGPDFAYRYCARLPESEIDPAWDLSQWKIAFNGSENIAETTLSSFAERFESLGFDKASFYPCYGLAENALLVTAGARGTGVTLRAFDRKALGCGIASLAEPQSRESGTVMLACCGTIHPDQEVCIADPETAVFLAENYVGEIWISGPSVCDGYLNQPARNITTFIERDGKRYLRTQDFGFLHQSALYLVGRLSERFKYEGRVYFTNEISLSMSQRLGGISVIVAPPSLPDRPLVTIMIEQEDPHHITHTHMAIAKAMRSCGIPLFAYYFVRKGFIVRTPSGKIRSDLTLDNILQENAAIIMSGDTLDPVFAKSDTII